MNYNKINRIMHELTEEFRENEAVSVVVTEDDTIEVFYDKRAGMIPTIVLETSLKTARSNGVLCYVSVNSDGKPLLRIHGA